MFTRYTPILRISKDKEVKMPTLPPRESMALAQIALNEAEDTCILCGWKIDYAQVAVNTAPEHEVDTHRTDLMLED